MTNREELISAELKPALLAQRDRLKADLEQERAAGSAERLGGQYSGEVHDRGEESSVDSQAEVNSAILRHHENELELVDRALARIEAGTYGACVGCGEEIEEARLRASPMTARCRDCQSAQEERR